MITLQVPGAPPGLQVAGIRHAAGATRAHARVRIRALLRALGASMFALDAGSVEIASAPGAAPRMLLDGRPADAGISISHEGAWSFCALCRGAAVGLDIMCVGLEDDWRQVAHDYLGPAEAGAIARAPAAARPRAFCLAWTAREAYLKSCALALSEWTPVEGDAAFFPFDGPPGHVGAIVLLGAAQG